MSILQWFKLFRLYQNGRFASLLLSLLAVAGARVYLKPGAYNKPRQRPFTVTLQNTMFAYEWGPKEFPVRACCEDRAIRLAREAANDYCQVVSVVEAAE